MHTTHSSWNVFQEESNASGWHGGPYWNNIIMKAGDPVHIALPRWVPYPLQHHSPDNPYREGGKKKGGGGGGGGGERNV